MGGQYHRNGGSVSPEYPHGCSLLFEKAISKYDIDVKKSWMVGDRIRDLTPAKSLGINTILVESEYNEIYSGIRVANLLEAVTLHILKNRL